MEALAEASVEDLIDLMPNYDTSRSSFLANSSTGNKSTSVKHVTNMELSAHHPPRVFGGGSYHLDPINHQEKYELKDIFTGLIDSINGELVSGVREYVLTGEIYEGPFVNNKRHGSGAIVKNVYLPKNSIAIGQMSSLPQISQSEAKFYGSYQNDEPSHGTLVVPNLFTYQGPLRCSKPHGEGGCLIKPCGFKYEGSFKDGLFHGYGIELDGNGGIYKGAFKMGVREGFGEFTSLKQAKLCKVSRKTEEKESIKCRYKGGWINNQKQGEGSERMGKEIYRGEFHANEKHGHGSIMWLKNEDDKIDDSVDDECRSQQEDENKHQVKDGIFATQHSKVNLLSLLNKEFDEIERDIDEDEDDTCYKSPQHSFPVVAEGSWRAGYPLNGTSGWTLMYENGDCYSGYATDFCPEGYGIMRYSNRDVYTGEWSGGKRCGEGCFISGDGKEEYIGYWNDDKIVPLAEGDRNDQMTRLTDMALVLLQDSNHDIDIDSSDDLFDDIESYEKQRQILESIVEKSLKQSIDRMNESRFFREEWKSPVGKRRNLGLGRNIANILVTPKKAQPSQSEDSAGDSIQVDSKKNDEDFHKFVETVADVSISDEKLGEVLNDLDDAITPTKLPDAPSKKSKLKVYENGDTYLGDHCEDTGLRHGYGVYVSSSTGSTYSGNFEQGVKSGFGILLARLGKYSGNFVKDKKEGHGTLIFNDASSYNGEFKENEFHGTGTLCKNDTVYTGGFYMGLKHGKGHESYADGRVYRGSFVDNQRSGKGTLHDKSGRMIYEGHWLNNIFHGEGMYYKTEIAKDTNEEEIVYTYQGLFFNGLRHGFGSVSINKEKALVLKGPFHKDVQVSGKWRINYPDGQVFSGDAIVQEEITYKEFKPEDGIKIIPSTSDAPRILTRDTYQIPTPNGFGAFRYQNSDVYIGEFQNGLRQGSGSLFSNGVQLSGNWKEDRLNLDNSREISTLTEFSDISSNSSML